LGKDVGEPGAKPGSGKTQLDPALFADVISGAYELRELIDLLPARTVSRLLLVMDGIGAVGGVLGCLGPQPGLVRDEVAGEAGGPR
jgi:hypothetical protein